MSDHANRGRRDGFPWLQRKLSLQHLHPTQLIVLSFAAVIATGTLLLSLPIATRSGVRLRLVDALFTATSATCVTGLVVVDTGSTFSAFGQMVILALIQIGGLGLMTFTTVFAVTLGTRLDLTQQTAIQESFHHTRSATVVSLLRYIVIATVGIELAGASVLSLHWWRTGRFESIGDTMYHAVFHAISAFCNAGFALYPDSLVGFQQDAVVVLVISALIGLGGLGFLVGWETTEAVRQWLPGRGMCSDVRRRRPRISLHSRLVLGTTAALLAIGTVSYYVLERDGVLAGLSGPDAWMNAYFSAVTPRTAGFNTVDYGQMGGAALLCTMVLMMIGASPGSAGGGVKTSTFALLLAYGLSRWRGHARLHLFNRTLPQEAVDKASAVVISAVALVILASSVLMATETVGMAAADSQKRFLGVLFETISAFGTVGLSLGQTPLLSDAGKIVVSMVMFMGRIGPLTLALAITLRRHRVQYRYAEENVMVG